MRYCSELRHFDAKFKKKYIFNSFEDKSILDDSENRQQFNSNKGSGSLY
jgi:hypothetical protein